MDDTGYENTYAGESYADGCACSSCRSEGRDTNQPGERCTVSRWRDSDI
ncbi:hypothetical protein [Plantibacter sp. CFBP 8804]|nr:hypothetical protein [Plantibacter sp. CFBP 8804]MBD8519180.1 hypothetical protein [Plantibacter sp. CFBP 8804]